MSGQDRPRAWKQWHATRIISGTGTQRAAEAAAATPTLLVAQSRRAKEGQEGNKTGSGHRGDPAGDKLPKSCYEVHKLHKLLKLLPHGKDFLNGAMSRPVCMLAYAEGESACMDGCIFVGF